MDWSCFSINTNIFIFGGEVNIGLKRSYFLWKSLGWKYDRKHKSCFILMVYVFFFLGSTTVNPTYFYRNFFFIDDVHKIQIHNSLSTSIFCFICSMFIGSFPMSIVVHRFMCGIKNMLTSPIWNAIHIL